MALLQVISRTFHFSFFTFPLSANTYLSKIAKKSILDNFICFFHVYIKKQTPTIVVVPVYLLHYSLV